MLKYKYLIKKENLFFLEQTNQYYKHGYFKIFQIELPMLTGK